MRCITPQITWHNREPVLCIDFDPTNDASQGFYRLATGGADSHLLIWHLEEPDTLKPNLLCVADLTRHQKAVNAVRFSPDGNLIASADDDANIYIWKNEGKTKTEETWLVDKILRKHLEDVGDLCWSADGAYLVSASVDNSAVMWDVKKKQPMYVWPEHNGLVQGIAFDPRGEFVATMCTDRQLRLFNAKTGKITPKSLKYPDGWLASAAASAESSILEEVPEPTEKDEGDAAVASTPKPPPVQVNRLFHDDSLRTFCRRLTFSPRGELLMVPGGMLPPSSLGKENSTPPATVSEVPASLPATPTTQVTQDSNTKGKKSRKSIGEKEVAVSNHGVVIFCRNSFTNPCVIIPTGSSYSIATRFCPVYFQREEEVYTYDSEFVNPSKKSERMIACVGKLRPRKKEKRVLMDMPYKLVYAIATNNSVIIGSTASNQPLALIRNIHCTRLSDITWSSNGRVLLVSSTDGYCSIISFADKELGIPAEPESILEITPTCFPVLSDVKKKELKKKEKDSEANKKTKDKDPATPVANKKDVLTPKKPLALEKAFKKVEKQKELKQKEKQLTPSKSDEKVDRDFASPVRRATAATPTDPSPTAEDSTSEEKLGEKTPKSVKATPQRNTLDRWIVKKSANASENSTPKSEAKTRSTSPLRKSANSKGRLLGFAPSEYKPVVEIPKADLSPTGSRSPSPTVKITPAEIAKLERAPIIIDLESDDKSDSSNDLSSSSSSSSIKTEPQPDVKITVEVNNETITSSSIPIATPKCGEKRPATSPLSPVQLKQPRRVQLITLSSAPLEAKKPELPE